MRLSWTMREKHLELQLSPHAACAAAQVACGPPADMDAWLQSLQQVKQVQRQLLTEAQAEDATFDSRLGRWNFAPKIEIDDAGVKVGVLVTLSF